jgi:hypothetical protein
MNPASLDRAFPFVSTLVATLALAFASGCGGSMYQTSRVPSFDGEAREVDDAEIQRAFEAKPQMPEHVQVAFYSYDSAKTEAVGEMVKKLPGVEGVYEIPKLVVTGERRLADAHPWDPPREVSLKKLRLIAARAHADLLVVVDHGGRWENTANGFAALTPLLVPVFAAPFLDIEAKSYVDAFVIDTRNGYLYGHLTADEQDEEKKVTIYEADRGKALVEAQWPRLAEKTEKGLAALLRDERARAPKKVPEAAAKQDPQAAR